MPKGSFDMRAWALIGAQHRLRELDDERNAIHAAFPELRRSTNGAAERSTTQRTAQQSTASATVSKKHRKGVMSKEARERIAAAQRLRWAKLKKAQKSA